MPAAWALMPSIFGANEQLCFAPKSSARCLNNVNRGSVAGKWVNRYFSLFAFVDEPATPDTNLVDEAQPDFYTCANQWRKP
jgi:hypothetical protein